MGSALGRADLHASSCGSPLVKLSEEQAGLGGTDFAGHLRGRREGRRAHYWKADGFRNDGAETHSQRLTFRDNAVICFWAGVTVPNRANVDGIPSVGRISSNLKSVSYLLSMDSVGSTPPASTIKDPKS